MCRYFAKKNNVIFTLIAHKDVLHLVPTEVSIVGTHDTSVYRYAAQLTGNKNLLDIINTGHYC